MTRRRQTKVTLNVMKKLACEIADAPKVQTADKGETRILKMLYSWYFEYLVSCLVTCLCDVQTPAAPSLRCIGTAAET